MKCLSKYKWVKLYRAALPQGKGIMGYWARLAGRAAFRHGNAQYCGYTTGANLLKAIGLDAGAKRYENADKTDKLDSSCYYYQSDVLIDALAASLEANATTVKNALEAYVAANGGTKNDITDGYAHTGTASDGDVID